MQVISPGTGCYGKWSSRKSILRRGCPPVAIGESHRGLIHDRAPPLREAPYAFAVSASSGRIRPTLGIDSNRSGFDSSMILGNG